MSKATDKNIYTFNDEKTVADPILEYSPTIAENKVPLVIDNGGYQCRVGWATEENPQFIFKNITAKQRGKKENEIQIGNDISNIEVVRWNIRTQFDRNVVTMFDVQEQIFDYVFTHLGITTEGKVDHPIVLTEPPCNPNISRQQMSELLFECYHIPEVTYGVDAMFSFYQNKPLEEINNAIIVDCGYQATHILPVYKKHLHAVNSRRINFGGIHLDTFMQRLLQLKYPGHFAAITLSRCEGLLRDHCYLATDYLNELDQWTSTEYYTENVHKIQLPYNTSSGSQLTAEQQKERRLQQIKRLKEVNQKRRLEKLKSDEDQLKELMAVQELMLDGDKQNFIKALYTVGLKTSEELQQDINKLTIGIQRAQAKILGVEPPPEEPEVKKPIFNLLNIPDDQLTQEQLETKKRQRILKSAQDGRAKAQALQRAKRQKELEEEKVLEDRRKNDFLGWLMEVRNKRQKILESRNVRRKKKGDMAKRRTYASQQRMKIITQLAQKSSKKEDTFGQNDADWEVYKEINPEMGTSDSEAEDEKLEELENMLREHDPEFQRELDFGGLPGGEFNLAEYYQLHLAVEKIRVPEILFQPSMVGIEQAGIAESMDYVLKKYQPEDQNKLVKCVFLTGGNSNIPNFKERMEKELLEMRPFQSTFTVYKAANPSLDAWLGARKWSLSPYLKSSCIRREDYNEMGEGYIKEHLLSNQFFPTPILVPKPTPTTVSGVS
ncbi:actin-related protein 5 [Patella vulgata]|uniref:actin-related protein 5 n=1 Tax=Patella vulgata TaxID=6465 RepID=UPI00217F7771|nr:actin-related protein 5 [Patella vulgata]